MEEKVLSILTFTNSDGIEVTANIDKAAVLTVVTDGKKKMFNVPKGMHSTQTDITLMSQAELKNEIRNANSVLYKTTKRHKDNGTSDSAEAVAAQATQQARVDAAKSLMEVNFPNEKKATKANKAQAIFKAINESNLPEDQKAAALAKLEALIAVLNTAAATGTPAADVAASAVVAPVEEVKAEVGADAATAEALETPVEEESRRRR